MKLKTIDSIISIDADRHLQIEFEDQSVEYISYDDMEKIMSKGILNQHIVRIGLPEIPIPGAARCAGPHPNDLTYN